MKTTLLTLLITICSTSIFANDKTTTVVIDSIAFHLTGKWQKVNHREESAQYGFVENESKLNISLSVRDPKEMEFYFDTLSNCGIVESYYNWESDYWTTEHKVKIQKLNQDSNNNFIVWYLAIPQGENIILFGLKENRLISIHLNNSNDYNKMAEDEAIQFLTNIYIESEHI